MVREREQLNELVVVDGPEATPDVDGDYMIIPLLLDHFFHAKHLRVCSSTTPQEVEVTRREPDIEDVGTKCLKSTSSGREVQNQPCGASWVVYCDLPDDLVDPPVGVEEAGPDFHDLQRLVSPLRCRSRRPNYRREPARKRAQDAPSESVSTAIPR
jgi:hypothetical protein